MAILVPVGANSFRCGFQEVDPQQQNKKTLVIFRNIFNRCFVHFYVQVNNIDVDVQSTYCYLYTFYTADLIFTQYYEN